MEKILLKTSKYEGRYVAIKDFDATDVIADGKTPDVVYRKAERKGITDPVVFYVPVKGMVHIY